MTDDQLRQAFEKWAWKNQAVDVIDAKVFDLFILPLWRALDFYQDERNYTNDGIVFITHPTGENDDPEYSQEQDFGKTALEAKAEVLEKLK